MNIPNLQRPSSYLLDTVDTPSNLTQLWLPCGLWFRLRRCLLLHHVGCPQSRRFGHGRQDPQGLAGENQKRLFGTVCRTAYPCPSKSQSHWSSLASSHTQSSRIKPIPGTNSSATATIFSCTTVRPRRPLSCWLTRQKSPLRSVVGRQSRALHPFLFFIPPFISSYPVQHAPIPVGQAGQSEKVKDLRNRLAFCRCTSSIDTLPLYLNLSQSIKDAKVSCPAGL